jgi:hypothetical protein
VKSENEVRAGNFAFHRPEEVTEMTSVTPLSTIYSLIGIYVF